MNNRYGNFEINNNKSLPSMLTRFAIKFKSRTLDRHLTQRPNALINKFIGS